MPYNDFFIATEDELNAVFRGWKRATPLLDAFVTRSGRNPFTGEPVTIRTLVSDDQPEADPDAVLAVDVSHLPRLEMKNLTPTELQMLACVVLGWDEDRAIDEIVGRELRGPAEAELFVCELPPALVARLAELTPAACAQYGHSWAEHIGDDTPHMRGQGAHSTPVTELGSNWASILARFAKLAHRAAVEHRMMFFLMTS